MPIYEYNCAKCGKTFEIIQKMSDKPLKTHAGCGGKVTKLISASGFQFKGTGWYVTDYGKKGKEPSSESNGGSSKTSGSSTEKPATSPSAPESKDASKKSKKPSDS